MRYPISGLFWHLNTILAEMMRMSASRVIYRRPKRVNLIRRVQKKTSLLEGTRVDVGKLSDWSLVWDAMLSSILVVPQDSSAVKNRVMGGLPADQRSLASVIRHRTVGVSIHL